MRIRRKNGVLASAQASRFQSLYRKIGNSYKNNGGVRVFVKMFAVFRAWIVNNDVSRSERKFGIVESDAAFAVFYEHNFAEIMGMQQPRFSTAAPFRTLITYRKQQLRFVFFFNAGGHVQPLYLSADKSFTGMNLSPLRIRNSSARFLYATEPAHLGSNSIMGSP